MYSYLGTHSYILGRYCSNKQITSYNNVSNYNLLVLFHINICSYYCGGGGEGVAGVGDGVGSAFEAKARVRFRSKGKSNNYNID